MSEAILRVTESVAERLRADEFFAGIPVFDEAKGDVASEIEQVLGAQTMQGGKVGVCAVVMLPSADDEMTDTPGGPLDFEFGVLVLEQVALNQGPQGTGKSALEVARRVHRVLKHFRCVGVNQCLVPVRRAIAPADTRNGEVGYEVRFRAQEADTGAVTKVAMPTMVPYGGTAPQTVTLTCLTAGASVYYTVDGSYPRAGNGAAVLYTVPFVVATAKVVRAAAFKTGWLGSDVNEGVFV